MKTITILTATRAEYGLLYPLIKKLEESKKYNVKLVVTGAHLAPEFGLTYREIEKDGIEIDKKIEILLSSDTPAAISKTMGLALISFADYFKDSKPDALIVLGDRYETLAVCCAAMNERIPIIHLYGGETTEGAIDEAVRHAITKMSFLHFTSTEQYRKRVIQLGENPERVFCVGAIGIENAMKKKLMTREELALSLDFKLDGDYAVVTFLPVTLDECSAQKQYEQVLKAFDRHSNMKYIITKANADSGGRIINQMSEEYAQKHDNVYVIESLGMVRYLSALKYAKMVIGNSSSGLVEAPSFRIPTINIGDRQRGRICAESVINCNPEEEQISLAMEKACSEEFRSTVKHTINPYGDGNASDKMIKIIDQFMSKDIIELKKKFYDLE